MPGSRCVLEDNRIIETQHNRPHEIEALIQPTLRQKLANVL